MPLTPISLLVPTRGRPRRLRDMIASAMDTAAHPEFVHVALRMDTDDFQGRDDKPWTLPRVNVEIGVRRPLSDLWNEALRAAPPEYNMLLMQGNDDILFRSTGWDNQLRAAFEAEPDRLVFVHGNDGSGVWGGDFGTFGFVHRRWVETVGYLTPPGLKTAYGDKFLNDVANALGRRRYVPEIITEHMHVCFGKADDDQTYQDQVPYRGEAGALYGSAEMVAMREAAIRALHSKMYVG